jgi:hypothetical protein
MARDAAHEGRSFNEVIEVLDETSMLIAVVAPD